MDVPASDPLLVSCDHKREYTEVIAQVYSIKMIS